MKRKNLMQNDDDQKTRTLKAFVIEVFGQTEMLRDDLDTVEIPKAMAEEAARFISDRFFPKGKSLKDLSKKNLTK